MRKTTNYLRRKYQTARNNEEKKEKNKASYFAQKSKYAATIKGKKTKSLIEYCSLTIDANTWNTVYRLAAGNNKSNTHITTLREPEGSLTRDTQETLRLILEYFTPEDNDLEFNDHHKQVRDITARLPNPPDDRD